MKRADIKVSRSTTNVGEDFTKIVNRTGTSARGCGDSVVPEPPCHVENAVCSVMWLRRTWQGSEAIKRWRVGMGRGAGNLLWKQVAGNQLDTRPALLVVVSLVLSHCTDAV